MPLRRVAVSSGQKSMPMVWGMADVVSGKKALARPRNRPIGVLPGGGTKKKGRLIES